MMRHRHDLVVGGEGGVLQQGASPLDPGQRPGVAGGIDLAAVGDERLVESCRQLGEDLVATVRATGGDDRCPGRGDQLGKGLAPRLGSEVREHIVRSQVDDSGAVGGQLANGPFGPLADHHGLAGHAGGFQVGVRVAHALGRPIVNGIKGIDVGDGSVTARREIDGGFEVYEVPTPAVLGVKEGINLPRYPTMKGRLASKKAALATVEQPTEAGGQERLRLHRPVEQVSETVILGEGPEAAAAVVDVLEELGVLA